CRICSIGPYIGRIHIRNGRALESSNDAEAEVRVVIYSGKTRQGVCLRFEISPRYRVPSRKVRKGGPIGRVLQADIFAARIAVFLVPTNSQVLSASGAY